MRRLTERASLTPLQKVRFSKNPAKKWFYHAPRTTHHALRTFSCLLIFLAALFAASPARADSLEKSTSFKYLFDIFIENKAGGLISVEYPDGRLETIGKALAAAGTANKKGYTASGWARDSAVAATAVNAVHIRIRKGESEGVIFSILPKEFFKQPQDYKSYYNSSSSIMTDIPAGSLFFGGAESPYVGNPVEVMKDGGWVSLPSDFEPREGDVLRIRVGRAEPRIASIEFANRFGGPVTVHYVGGAEEVVAQVLKPVAGVGRFDGSFYADVGRLRANHSGVICVSTSPPGEIGGFQIIPEQHGMSPEMKNARLLTQWMVVGPTTVGGDTTAATAPLFSDALRPIYFPLGETGRSIEQMLDMYIVQVRVNDGPWERMPARTGRDDSALLDVTHVRILFPLEAGFMLD